jgi:Cu-Zn family superoxide dismutase
LRGTREEVLSQIFDADGTAVVIHATADDYRTDPSGNSGGRIACGVLMPA